MLPTENHQVFMEFEWCLSDTRLDVHFATKAYKNVYGQAGESQEQTTAFV